MVRSLALLAGLAAVAPAFAGEMSVDEARHFVVGKTFYYTCFEGTHGKGRVFADGSVVGSVQFQGNGPMRFAALPAGTLRDHRRLGLRLRPRSADRALFQSRAHRFAQLPRIDQRARFCLLRLHPPRRPHHAARGARARNVRSRCGRRSLPTTTSRAIPRLPEISCTSSWRVRKACRRDPSGRLPKLQRCARGG